MSATWHSEDEPAPVPITVLGWLRIVVRGSLLAIVTFGCLGLLLLVRLVERPMFGTRRPVTPYITQFVCRSAFAIMGIRYRHRGKPVSDNCAVVSNHASWMDIFALNAPMRLYFVSKAEVANWPGIGWLARATGTVFIARDRKQAAEQKTVFEKRLQAGHKLLFFPEGTSTDGCRVLRFRPTLFAAFFEPHLHETLFIQPVTVIYRAPNSVDPRFYGWWGDMEFGPHLLKVLAAAKQGEVEVVLHDPVRVRDYYDRKALAAHCERVVRNGLSSELARTLLT